MTNSVTNVKFILSSITNGLLFWTINHTSVYEYSELNVFRNLLVKSVIIDKMIYLEQMNTKHWILITITDNLTTD